MTVKDLIEELKEYPLDLPVVCDFKELFSVELSESTYFLNKSEDGYSCSSAVVLEWYYDS